MAVKRVITDKEKIRLKEFVKFRGKNKNNISNEELKELVILIAKKLNIIKG